MHDAEIGGVYLIDEGLQVAGHGYLWDEEWIDLLQQDSHNNEKWLSVEMIK
jgi:hypothetical protein